MDFVKSTMDGSTYLAQLAKDKDEYNGFLFVTIEAKQVVLFRFGMHHFLRNKTSVTFTITSRSDLAGLGTKKFPWVTTATCKRMAPRSLSQVRCLCKRIYSYLYSLLFNGNVQ